MFWIDGSLDNGWHIGVGLYRCRPHDGGRPAVTVNVLRPGETFFEQHVTLDDVDFVPSDFGGRWGSAAELVGELDERGNPIGYRLTVDVGRVSMDLMGVVVAAGMKFTTATPGYSHVRPDTGAAVGWWPVAPRSDVRGWISADGARADVTGRTHMERQLSSFRLAGSPGAPSAQSIWTWGHLTCDDYTGIWTDSAASEHMGYRHFTPFVLYRGSDPVLSTFAFSSSVERYVIEPSSGLPRPAVFTLKAAEGERELFARITGGRIHDQFELDGNAGAPALGSHDPPVRRGRLRVGHPVGQLPVRHLSTQWATGLRRRRPPKALSST
jgi:hypothetical protein